MDFKRVLVTDRLAWEIFSAGAREKLLFRRDPHEPEPRTRLEAAGQRALSLLVLFDHLVVQDVAEGIFRLPDLEKEGIVEIAPASELPEGVPSLKSNWSKRSPRRRPPRRLLQSLSLVKRFQPLVLNRLSGPRDKFFSSLARALGVSQRQCISLFLDYALAHAQGDEAASQESLFSRAMPADLLRDITTELFDYSSGGNDVLSPTNAMLVMATIFADEIAIVEHLSSELKLPVATEHYGEKFRSEPALKGEQLDALAAANRFLILRAALADEGRFMPRIEGIKHALSLRRDPHLKAVRDHLAVFHGALSAGDRDAIREARREIQRARRRLERRAGWDQALRWLAYFAVPVGVAECLTGNIPIVGTSLSLVGATGAAITHKVGTGNDWVLFGT